MRGVKTVGGISRYVLVLGALGLCSLASAGEYVSFYGFADVRTAYHSRGVIVNKDPFSATYACGRVHLGPFGYVGAWMWNVSAYTGTGQSARRRYAFHENDFAPEYGYLLDLAEGWSLDSTVNRKWIDLQGYAGHPETMHEWTFRQTLDNPYVTPYYLMRYSIAPTCWGDWDVGVFRRFALAEGLSLTPKVYCEFGDGHHFEKQYGVRDHGCGLQALNVELRLDYALSDYLGLYAGLQEFVLVDPEARSAFRQSSAVQSVTELTIFTVGVYVKY